MSYQVDWSAAAEQDLAALWTSTPDRDGVTAAAERIDDRLARDPLHFGEPWTSSVHRIAVHGPIGVEYEVIEDDSRVIVHGVFTAG